MRSKLLFFCTVLLCMQSVWAMTPEQTPMEIDAPAKELICGLSDELWVLIFNVNDFCSFSDFDFQSAKSLAIILDNKIKKGKAIRPILCVSKKFSDLVTRIVSIKPQSALLEAFKRELQNRKILLPAFLHDFHRYDGIPNVLYHVDCSNKVDIVKLLLCAAGDHAQDLVLSPEQCASRFDRWTALMDAAYSGSVQIIQLVLRAGGSKIKKMLSYQDQICWNAQMYASGYGKQNAAMLIDNIGKALDAGDERKIQELLKIEIKILN